MARTTAEYALGRALAYLRWSGIPINRDIIHVTLLIVGQAVAEGDADLIERVMVELPHRIAGPDLRLPPATPPIKRASIGYAPYL